VTALPPLSRAVDRATGLAGVLVLVATLVVPGSLPPWPAWLALPAVVLAGRRPLVLPTVYSESLVIGLDSALLVLLGLTVPVRQALVVWAVSLLVAELTTRRSLDTRAFNAGVCILSGLLALVVISGLPVAERTDPAGLGVTVVAGAVYFLFDYLWSGVSVAVAERAPLRRTLRSEGLPLAFGCFLGVYSVGFLAAVLVRSHPWTVVLLALPFVSLLLATHSWSQLRQVEHRSGALSTAAVALQQATTVERVEQLVLQHAAALVRVPSAVWGDPRSAEDGLAFLSGPEQRRLLLAGRITGEALTEQDLTSLRLLLSVAEQAHERLRLLEELRRSALHDPLTGLANRTLMRETLTQACAGSGGLAVLYCDLDGFKQLNDTRGHAAGDALLIAVAARLARTVRAGDLVARLGGDEFGVLLRSPAGGDVGHEARQLAERLCSALAVPYEVPGGPVRVPASVGMCLREGDEQPQDLLSGSDSAMYAAKAAGGGRVVVHRPSRPGAPGAPVPSGPD
jgi:diguanylate cyclase (GGDEF)-like protein